MRSMIELRNKSKSSRNIHLTVIAFDDIYRLTYECILLEARSNEEELTVTNCHRGHFKLHTKKIEDGCSDCFHFNKICDCVGKESSTGSG